MSVSPIDDGVFSLLKKYRATHL